MFNAEAGYAQTRKVSADPRQIEATLLNRFANAIESAAPETADGYRRLAAAVHDNSQLWSAIAVDLGSPENQLPDELRAGLLNIAEFCLTQGLKVLNGNADRMPLVRINREVAAGLAARTEALADVA